ncbi:MAG: VapE family protein, partial [Acutalibacteraceae bacterium]|nr:VapE family protein [Acutalibacteraceae bacterium]
YQTPLTCSYIGTSNPRQYLSDETGNRRWCPVKLKDIDKNFMSSEEGQRLIRELHSYYNRITQKMTTKQVRKMVEFSPELAKFMEELTEEALITYSDYEACCKVINMWMWGDSVAQMAPAPEGAELLQADVERLAFERGYRMRITQKSCLKAMADCGLTLVAKMENGKLKNVWIKPEKKSEQTPF